MTKEPSTIGSLRGPGAIVLWGAIVAAALYPLLLVVLAHLHSGGQDSFPLDDPWIHLTFARNLSEHGSFAYFPGSPASAGSTAPLYTMLLAVGFLITSNEKLLSYLLGITAQIVFLIAMAHWARCRLLVPATAGPRDGSGRRSSRSAGWTIWPAFATLLIGLDPRVGILAVSGMETSLYLALLALTFWGRASGRHWLFGIALGASLWVRPDTLILILVFGIDLALSYGPQRSRPKKGPQPAAPPVHGRPGVASPALGLLLALGFTVAYLVFHLALFGQPLPNTFTAKTTYYHEVPRLMFLLRDLPAAFTSNGWLVVAAFALLAMGREFVRLFRRGSATLRAETGWVLALALAYLVLLPFSHRFSRYLVPALPAFAILGASSLQWIASSKKWPGRYAAALLAVAALTFQAYGAFRSSAEYEGTCLYHWVRHERTGRWLEANTPPDAVVATHDIGAIGYYSHRRVVDIVGLLDPEIVPYLGTPSYIPRLRELLLREKVTHLAVLRNWLEVANVEPIFLASTQPELLEIYEWDPASVHLVPKPASALSGRASALLDAKDLQGAREALQLSLRIDPENSRTWYLLGVSEEMSRDYLVAAAHYRKTYELHPRHFDARYREGQVLLAAGQRLEALRSMHELLDVKPDYPTVYDQYMRLRKELGPAADAIAHER